jgi:hypothetical protein
MAKKVVKNKTEENVIEFVLDDVEPVSSGESSKAVEVEANPAPLQTTAAELDLENRSPAFKELALPKLPTLEKQNRARLQVQSPNRIFFYWSLKGNPFQALGRSIGVENAGYTLALRLIDIETEREELHAIEPDGSWWFNSEAGRSYRAEIGFYSPSRPFIRILFSNTVTTPRRSPSHRAATDADWRVGAYKFAEVLDVSGFEKDAFDVAIAGDDPQTSQDTTHTAFRQFIGSDGESLDGISAEELRYVMLAIASGRALEDLRFKIGAALFAILEAHANRLAAENAAASLSEFFDIDEVEFEEEEYGPAVFGNSLVNFPKRFKTRSRTQREREYAPVSSHVLGS